MSTDITTPSNFQERMMERIKASIGDLITDDELKKLVDRGMDEVFFKKEIIKVGYYDTKQSPSFMEKIVKELMEDKVRERMKVYLTEHEKEVLEVVEKVIKEGAGAAVMQALASTFSSQLFTLQNNIQNQLQSMRN